MLLAAILAATLQAASAELQDFQRRAEATLLAGRGLQPGYRQELMAMSPEDRIEALIYLRRIGLLTGKAWQIGDLLRPAPDDQKYPFDQKDRE